MSARYVPSAVKRVLPSEPKFALWLFCFVLTGLPALCGQVPQTPDLVPTAAALDTLRNCGSTLSTGAPDLSIKILNSQRALSEGLLTGWGQTRDGWNVEPPPEEYVKQLSLEAEGCVAAANQLTDPAKQKAATETLTVISEDLRMKAADCRAGEWEGR